MISINKQTGLCLTIALLSLILVNSCQPPASGAKDEKDELVRSLKGANVEGFHFATQENESQEVSSLTNSAVSNLIKFDEATTNVVLRYTSIKNKETNTTNTYKTEIVKTGTALDFLITDIATGEAIFKKTLPPITNTDNPPAFDSFEACINNFNCKNQSALQCEANRTCEPQFAALICCRTDGQCISVHLVIRPNTTKCKLRDLVPDLDGILVTR